MIHDLQPIFLGFRLKAYCPKPAGWGVSPQTDHIVEICSASGCMAGSPGFWQDIAYNRALCHNREPAAQAEPIANDDTAEYQLYAFYALPLLFGQGSEPKSLMQGEMYVHKRHEEFFEQPLSPLPAQSPLVGYQHLGYDVLQYTDALTGCSPLSCNYLAYEFPVNRYCLLDDQQAAHEFAQICGREEPEPGPYIVVEVWRKEIEAIDGLRS
jgi:hypothetical protein